MRPIKEYRILSNFKPIVVRVGGLQAVLDSRYLPVVDLSVGEQAVSLDKGRLDELIEALVVARADLEEELCHSTE